MYGVFILEDLKSQNKSIYVDSGILTQKKMTQVRENIQIETYKIKNICKLHTKKLYYHFIYIGFLQTLVTFLQTLIWSRQIWLVKINIFCSNVYELIVPLVPY